LEIGFLSHALFKIDRHSANAYPGEAYGFCLGMTDLAIVFAALPVGVATQTGEARDRFHDLAQAFAPAQKLAFSCNMDILAIYHSHSDLIAQTPLAFVPKEFTEKPLLITRIREGEPLPEDYYYFRNSSDRWQRFEAKRVARKILLGEFNPRLILSRWNMIWGKVTQP